MFSELCPQIIQNMLFVRVEIIVTHRATTITADFVLYCDDDDDDDVSSNTYAAGHKLTQVSSCDYIIHHFYVRSTGNQFVLQLQCCNALILLSIF
jgi:hypothetical protein